MRRFAILLAVLLLPGCVYHSGPYGYRSAPVVYSSGYWRPPPPRFYAPPPRHWHGSHGWHRPGPPRWHGHSYSHRPYRHHHHWR